MQGWQTFKFKGTTVPTLSQSLGVSQVSWTELANEELADVFSFEVGGDGCSHEINKGLNG